MESLIFKIIKHGSSEYQSAVSLRNKILRQPLGLSLTPEEQEQEKVYIHIAGFSEDDLCATAVLVPEDNLLKMRQVAVKENVQRKGHASAMLKFCEDYALDKVEFLIDAQIQIFTPTLNYYVY